MQLKDIDISGYDTLLLDRDGVINKLRPNDYVKCWEEFEFVPGIFEVLSKWSKHFKYIFIVTNQRGVGKGVMSEQDLLKIHQRMCEEIIAHKGRIDKIYYCTALTEEDNRRKPGNGMFLDIILCGLGHIFLEYQYLIFQIFALNISLVTLFTPYILYNILLLFLLYVQLFLYHCLCLLLLVYNNL